jgi:hypothetical protein
MPDQRCAFVVRLWRPAPRPGHPPPGLRGSLQPAGSAEVRYFDALDDLPALLRDLTGWEAAEGGDGAD